MIEKFKVSFPGLGINDLLIDRVAFSLFGNDVYWYGILTATGLLLALLLSYRAAPRYGIQQDHVLDTVLYMIPLMIICARLYYVVFEWDSFKGNIKSIFALRDGGLAFYGGFIGGVITLIIVVKLRKLSLSRLMDLLVVYVPLGQGIGRWGNFFNQEAFGVNTKLPWGMISNGTADYLRRTGTGDPSLPVHPTFLYEFLANMLIFAVLLYIRKRSRRPYVTTASYFIMYGFIRFFVESLRTDSLFIGNTSLRASMVLSALMVLASSAYIIYVKRQPVVEGKAGLVELASEQAEEQISDIPHDETEKEH